MENSRNGYHPSSKGLVTEQLVKKQLDSLNTSKSPGQDKDHLDFLYEMRDFLTPIRTKIFNKSWDKTKLPEDWNLAHLDSIFKKGKSH